MDKKKTKKSFFKRFWWIGLIVIIVFIFLLITSLFNHKSDQQFNNDKRTNNTYQNLNEKGEKTRSFTAAELKAANLALENGVHIEDPQNDFLQVEPGTMQPDGRPDNPNPYPLNWTDFRSVTFGADENHFYIKFQYWGEFPKKPVAYNNDLMWDTGGKIEQFTFINNESKNDSADLGNGIMYITENEQGQRVATNPTIGQLAMISPIGVDEHLETVFKTMNGAGMIAGGPGYDYVMSAFPLRLFNLKIGDEVTFRLTTESGSSIYHHEAIDFILDNSSLNAKSGSTIRYKLGSNTYENLGIPDNMREVTNEETTGNFPKNLGLPSCPGNLSGYFTAPFVSIQNLDHIIPLGAVGPDHIEPTDHIYLILKNNLDNIPVYVPTDARITNIQEENFSKKTEVVADNHLMMYVCEGLQLNYYHISNLSKKIKNAMKSASKECSNNTDSGGYYSEWCYYNVNISINSGEQIGNSNSFDIGLYNYMKPQQFANPERYQDDTNLYATCPLDLYTEELKNKFYSFLGDFGYNRTIEPRCGTSMLDIVGTAQGSWFGSPVSDMDSQNKIAVLVPMNYNPGILGIDLGYAFPTQELIEFRPRTSGTINRAFSEVTPSDKIYCYYTDSSSGMGNVPVKVLIQLIDETHLKIEEKNGQCTTNEAFTNPFIFER